MAEWLPVMTAATTAESTRSTPFLQISVEKNP